MDFKAFITGSHAYGTPGPGSDIDVVVRCDLDVVAKLTALLAEPEAKPASDELLTEEPSGKDYPQLHVRSGRLNLLLCASDERFDVWRDGTAELKAMAPVTRDVAVAHFKALRERRKATKKQAGDLLLPAHKVGF